MAPETSDGRVLATVVGICAVLGASLFTAQVIKWVVGSERREERERQEHTLASDVVDPADTPVVDQPWQAVLAELAGLRAELAELRAVLGPATSPDGPGPATRGRLPG